jgi:hypothetical protein
MATNLSALIKSGHLHHVNKLVVGILSDTYYNFTQRRKESLSQNYTVSLILERFDQSGRLKN